MAIAAARMLCWQVTLTVPVQTNITLRFLAVGTRLFAATLNPRVLALDQSQRRLMVKASHACKLQMVSASRKTVVLKLPTDLVPVTKKKFLNKEKGLVARLAPFFVI
jgi:hypothetical protein